MATTLVANVLKQEICKINTISACRNFTTRMVIYNKQQSGQSSPTASSGSSQVNANVPGLSSAVLTAEEPVGPGASRSGEYKVPEYFNYNKTSYFEAEVEMLKYRLPQPVAKNNLM